MPASSIDATAGRAGMRLPPRVHTRKLCEIVADHFRAQIIRGELCDGEHLPTEGPLIDALGISRPTLREALRILESERLISIAPGTRQGARVHRPTLSQATRQLGYVLQAEGVTVADLGKACEALSAQPAMPVLVTIKRLLAGLLAVQPPVADRNEAVIDALRL